MCELLASCPARGQRWVCTGCMACSLLNCSVIFFPINRRKGTSLRKDLQKHKQGFEHLYRRHQYWEGGDYCCSEPPRITSSLRSQVATRNYERYAVTVNHVTPKSICQSSQLDSDRGLCATHLELQSARHHTSAELGQCTCLTIGTAVCWLCHQLRGPLSKRDWWSCTTSNAGAFGLRRYDQVPAP